MGKQSEFILQGLDCASCAAKVENAVKKMPDVSDVTVNSFTKTMVVESKNENLYEDISTLIKNVEPKITVKVKNDGKKHHDHDHHHHDHDHSHGNSSISKLEVLRFSIGIILFAIGILGNINNFGENIVFIIAYILIGGDVVYSAFRNILKGQVFDEFFLMSVATIGAFAIGEHSEAVAVMLFYQIGEIFQKQALDKSRKSIADLMDIRPEVAHVKKGNEIVSVSPEEVTIGDIIVVKPGEKVPLDSVVINGSSTIDTSALTGESVPRIVNSKDMILSGTVNLTGLLTAEVKHTIGESTVSKILNLVQNASNKKAKTEQFITKFAKVYTPAVVYFALALALIPPIFTDASFTDWIHRALVFLVISCPCALVISIPLGFFGGIGGASKQGILIKGGNYLEALNKVDTVVFDKTGTLTKGSFSVTKIQAVGDFTETEILQTAAYAEFFSNHPIAVSIMAKYEEKIDEGRLSEFEEIAGYGLKVKFDGRTILAGNQKLMHKYNVNHTEAKEFGTIVYIAVDGNFAGYLVISDEIKEDSKATVDALHSMGINRVIMLTGDSKTVGEEVAGLLGLDEVYTELLPDQKVEVMEQLKVTKKTDGRLIFVGDGINDAPVLALADVGVAMGGLGSDAAIEASDVVLMTDEPSKLVTAIRIAKRTKQIVWQNIAFALGVKGLVLLLGAGGLATMWEAVFADVGVALIAILNATRAMKSNN
ncbi:MAG: heavy metal translocating P-type ATPase [Bacillales bacterium]|jgi:Cd2+/Zn2+-exporting ATPase|nr:heavy metal translocating P-type ATPase [Bacillales bacterium]